MSCARRPRRLSGEIDILRKKKPDWLVRFLERRVRCGYITRGALGMEFADVVAPDIPLASKIVQRERGCRHPDKCIWFARDPTSTKRSRNMGKMLIYRGINDVVRRICWGRGEPAS